MISRPRSTSSPVTLRRAATLRKHWAKVSSYQSNLETGRQRSGETRRETVAAADRLCVSGHGPFRYVYPVPSGMYQAAVKVFIKLHLGLGSRGSSKSRCGYIEQHAKNYKGMRSRPKDRGRSGFLGLRISDQPKNFQVYRYPTTPRILAR